MLYPLCKSDRRSFGRMRRRTGPRRLPCGTDLSRRLEKSYGPSILHGLSTYFGTSDHFQAIRLSRSIHHYRISGGRGRLTGLTRLTGSISSRTP
ncbi:unnamed protein product, partial [Nesidiocoris tenuis]